MVFLSKSRFEVLPCLITLGSIWELIAFALLKAV